MQGGRRLAVFRYLDGFSKPHRRHSALGYRSAADNGSGAPPTPEAIASKPPIIPRLTKRLLKAAQREELPDFLDPSAAVRSIAHQTQDHLKVVNAFLDQPPATLAGRKTM